MEKIAARKLTRSQMLEILDRFRPTQKKINRLDLGMDGTLRKSDDEVKRNFREILKDSAEEMNPLSGTFDVPLAARLKNYKQIKRTGRMPFVSSTPTGVRVSGDSGYRMNLRDVSPKTVFSGGKKESLQRALQNPQTRFELDLLRPGRTRTEKGLYFAKDRQSAAAYSRAPREEGLVVGSTGKPAVLEATVPANRLISNKEGTEFKVLAQDLTRAKSKISSSRPHDMKGHLQRALAKYRAGKPLGATEKARLKARGLIARADGTVRKGKLGKR